MAKPRTSEDYDDDLTAASRVVLAEVATILGAYREALVLIGGWTPYLILQRFGEGGAEPGFAHVGSIDIDFVVDPDVVGAAQYATIVELLLGRGYEPVRDSRYQFERAVAAPRSGRDCRIRLDFLTPRPLVERGRARRHRLLQPDLEARTLEGAEVAFSHWYWHELREMLPDGARAHTRVKVCDVVGALALKGLAIGDRYAEKDAYDIYALCAHHAGGPAGVAGALRSAGGDPVLCRALDAIAAKFRAREAEGPTWVASFLSRPGTDEHERLLTDAFMSVNEVLRLLG